MALGIDWPNWMILVDYGGAPGSQSGAREVPSDDDTGNENQFGHLGHHYFRIHMDVPMSHGTFAKLLEHLEEAKGGVNRDPEIQHLVLQQLKANRQVSDIAPTDPGRRLIESIGVQP